jgi:peroxiredoxin (alkyl hydroperoxide reductase subunit C)
MFDICNDAPDVITMPLIGDQAPEFNAQTTNGPIRFPNDYAGKWIIFFSHPSDFTPVCTSEFIRFQELLSQFNEMNTDLVALSIGAIPSHLAWIHAISEMDDGAKISFPIIADMDTNIARTYGMIHDSASDTHAVRAVFIIDPHGIIRAILYYPAVLGRNFTEIMRIVVALQTADAFKVAIPADWVPGKHVLVPAPQTTHEMNRQQNAKTRGVDSRAWFLSYKPLKSEEIYERLTQKNSTNKKRK